MPAACSPCRHTSPAESRGLGLVEALIVVALTAILVTLALPSWQGWLQRRHLEGQSARFLADVQLLRQAAATRRMAWRLSLVSESGVGSGWALHSGDAGSCRWRDGQLECDSGVQLLASHWLPASEPVAVQANVASMRVDPRQGTLTPTGSWELVGRDGQRLRHVVNLLGRVRVCTPAAPMPGVPACS